MPTETGIEWTDATSNPLRYRRKSDGAVVWACMKVSTGCAHCYAERLALRYRRGGPFTLSEMAKDKLEPFVDAGELSKLLTSKKLSGKRVFLGDMTDIFGDWVSDELLDEIFAVLAVRSDVTFQILTKRPERMAAYVGEKGRVRALRHQLLNTQDGLPQPLFAQYSQAIDRLWEDGVWPRSSVPNAPLWPLPNVWLGVSVEDQAAADARIPWLLKTPSAVRFLSCEPLLGPVELKPYLPKPMYHCSECGKEKMRPNCDKCGTYDNTCTNQIGGIDWVICGGESGAGARPMHPDWARSLRDQCQAAGVPFFFKQWGESVDDLNKRQRTPLHTAFWMTHDGKTGDRQPQPDNCVWMSRIGKKAAGRTLDGREWNEFPGVQG